MHLAAGLFCNSGIKDTGVEGRIHLGSRFRESLKRKSLRILDGIKSIDTTERVGVKAT